MKAPIREYSTHIYEMMARLGIEPGAGVLPQFSLRYATALRRCEDCRSKKACQDWLDYAPAMVNFAPEFCMNADILFELQYDQAGPSRDCQSSQSVGQTNLYDRRATAASSSSSMSRRSVLNCSSKSASDGGPYRSASVRAMSAQSPGCNASTIAGKTTSSSKAICFLSLSMKSRTIRSTLSRRSS